MSAAHKAIYHKLSTDDGVTDIVGTSILPEFRENAIPSVIFEADMVEDHRSYEEVIVSEYEVSLSCVAPTMAEVDELVAAVIAAVDRQDWDVGSEVSVIGCWIENKEISSAQIGTRNVRACVVELTAKILLEGI